jgi:DNA-binding NarL/FixJ family response regulator
MAGAPGSATFVKLFVLDPHTIYRQGLVACLERLHEVDGVAHADSVRDAWEMPALFEAGLVLLDHTIDGGRDFISAVRAATGARVIVCTADCTEDGMVSAIHAGAVGFLRKDTLNTETLASAVRAALTGTGVVAPDLLESLLRPNGPYLVDRNAPALLTDREQQVLSLIAEGHPTREVAQELCYSERTVKNVLHDVVTKLNARTRSQAVAHAVREGLI